MSLPVINLLKYPTLWIKTRSAPKKKVCSIEKKSRQNKCCIQRQMAYNDSDIGYVCSHIDLRSDVLHEISKVGQAFLGLLDAYKTSVFTGSRGLDRALDTGRTWLHYFALSRLSTQQTMLLLMRKV